MLLTCAILLTSVHAPFSLYAPFSLALYTCTALISSLNRQRFWLALCPCAYIDRDSRRSKPVFLHTRTFPYCSCIARLNHLSRIVMAQNNSSYMSVQFEDRTQPMQSTQTSAPATEKEGVLASEPCGVNDTSDEERARGITEQDTHGTRKQVRWRASSGAVLASTDLETARRTAVLSWLGWHSSLPASFTVTLERYAAP